MDCSPSGSSVHEDSPGKNTGVGCYFLLHSSQARDQMQVSQHCMQILYSLSHQGSPIYCFLVLKYYLDIVSESL